VKVFVSKRAGRAVARNNARWHAKADDPEIFIREYLAAIDYLESVEKPGTPFPTDKRPHLKRTVLPKSHCHIYFDVDERMQMIRVLHVWDARRERAPKL
jgi:hypothetical protein